MTEDIGKEIKELANQNLHSKNVAIALAAEIRLYQSKTNLSPSLPAGICKLISDEIATSAKGLTQVEIERLIFPQRVKRADGSDTHEGRKWRRLVNGEVRLAANDARRVVANSFIGKLFDLSTATIIWYFIDVSDAADRVIKKAKKSRETLTPDPAKFKELFENALKEYEKVYEKNIGMLSSVAPGVENLAKKNSATNSAAAFTLASRARHFGESVDLSDINFPGLADD